MSFLPSKGSSSEVVFTPFASSSDFRLLELSPAVMKAFESGEEICLKGDNNGDVVLCTKSQTFQVRQAETSNTLLLLDSGSSTPLELSVAGQATCTYEFTPAPPRLWKLRVALSEYPLTCSELKRPLRVAKNGTVLGVKKQKEPDAMDAMDDGEKDDDDAFLQSRKEHAAIDVDAEVEDEEVGLGSNVKHIYTMKELERIVQASRDEIEKQLKEFNAQEFNGYWRLWSEADVSHAFNLMLETMEVEDWDPYSFPGEELIETFSAGTEEILARHTLNRFAHPVAAASSSSISDRQWTIVPEKVFLQLAMPLLEMRSAFLEKDFMAQWKESAKRLKLKEEPTFAMLKGYAIISRIGPSEYVHYLPAHEQVQNPLHRFKKLFEVKTRWTLKEIEPYFKDLVPPSSTSEQFLLKYARPNTPNKGEEGTIFTIRE